MCIRSHRFLCHPYRSWEFHDSIKHQCPGVQLFQNVGGLGGHSYDNAVTVEQLNQQSVFFSAHQKKLTEEAGTTHQHKKKQLQVSSYLPYLQVFTWILEGSDTLGGCMMYAFHVLSPDFWTNKNDIWTVQSGKSLILISKKAFQTKLTAANFRDWS